jgi:hypothetical protein
MNASMKRLRAAAKTPNPVNALGEWAVPVLPSDLRYLLKRLDNHAKDSVVNNDIGAPQGLHLNREFPTTYYSPNQPKSWK